MYSTYSFELGGWWRRGIAPLACGGGFDYHALPHDVIPLDIYNLGSSTKVLK
jgi:hypothetical protein